MEAPARSSIPGLACTSTHSRWLACGLCRITHSLHMQQAALALARPPPPIFRFTPRHPDTSHLVLESVKQASPPIRSTRHPRPPCPRRLALPRLAWPGRCCRRKLPIYNCICAIVCLARYHRARILAYNYSVSPWSGAASLGIQSLQCGQLLPQDLLVFSPSIACACTHLACAAELKTDRQTCTIVATARNVLDSQLPLLRPSCDGSGRRVYIYIYIAPCSHRPSRPSLLLLNPPVGTVVDACPPSTRPLRLRNEPNRAQWPPLRLLPTTTPPSLPLISSMMVEPPGILLHLKV